MKGLEKEDLWNNKRLQLSRESQKSPVHFGKNCNMKYVFIYKGVKIIYTYFIIAVLDIVFCDLSQTENIMWNFWSLVWIV